MGVPGIEHAWSSNDVFEDEQQPESLLVCWQWLYPLWKWPGSYGLVLKVRLYLFFRDHILQGLINVMGLLRGRDGKEGTFRVKRTC